MEYKKKPIYADFLVTPVCNYNCKFCSASASYNKDNVKAIDIKNIEKLFSDFDKMEMLRISIEGGEPFLRDDIIEILQMADMHDFEYYVNTNGSLIDKKMAKRLGNTKIPQICISLDGHNSEIHDRSRGVTGAYDKVISAIHNIHDNGIYVKPIITLTKFNYPYLYDTLKKIKELGMDSATIMLLANVGYAKKFDLALDFKEWSELLIKLTIDKREGRLPVDLKIVPTGEAECKWEICLPLIKQGKIDLIEEWIPKNMVSSMEDNEFGCTAGKENFAIDGWGNVFGCSLMVSSKSLSAGNIKENSIIDIWNDSPVFNEFRNLKLDNIEGNCKNCYLLSQCRGGCRACAYSTNNNIIGSDLRCPNTL